MQTKRFFVFLHMIKRVTLVCLLVFFYYGQAQEVSLPADLRQHALTQYNSSLFNPAFSLDRNNPESVSFWTRWQWQNVDTDPTTLFLNYSRGLNENSVAGLGFFQHNTGIYFNTGAALNYAHQFEFNRLIKVSVGANVFGFQQQIADTRFTVNPIPGIPQSNPTDDFILQVAPGVNLQVENFSLSLASENLFDFNFTDKEANTDAADKIFMGMASYDFPVMASDTTAYLRPSIYLRTIPEQPNQIGLNALFSTRKYWVQSGYNNFYGISVGGGGTFLERFSIGAVVEFGTSASLNSKDPSFEIIASYFIGNREERRPLVASGINDDTQQVVLIGEELTNAQIREELEKAEKLSNKEEEEIEEVEEPILPKVEEEETVTESESEPIEEISTEVETKESKKEARRLAAEQKAIEKQKRKDALAEEKREKEALAVLKKQEEEAIAAAKEAEEFKEAEAVLKRQEEESEAAAKEAAELKEAELKKATELAEANRLEEQKKQEALKKAENEKATAEAESQRKEQQRKLDSIDSKRKAAAVRAAQELENKKKQDAIEEAKKKDAIAEALKLKEQRRTDSILKVKEAKELEAKKAEEESVVVEIKETSEPEVVELEAGEKYEEVATEDGLEPGYYLIANVFGTKKYFDAFMRDLTNKGIQPKSFYRNKNKYNYAYLERYNTIREARSARDSRFNGKYSGKTWIFRVVGK